MICPCGGQIFSASKTSVLLIGLILTRQIRFARSHGSEVPAYISTYAELLDAWSSNSVHRSQHLVLTSHISIEPEVEGRGFSQWIGISNAEIYDQLGLSVRGSCSESPPADWRVDGKVLPGQCVLQFPENSTYTSDQLIRIEGAVRSNFDIWIADIYVIAGRLVDLEVLRGNESTEGQVNLWTSNVTLQDTPVAKSTSLGRFTVTPPHSVRHDGATFINPCGPALNSLSSTACIGCQILQCNIECTESATSTCDRSVQRPTAIAVITDAGTGNLLLQGLTTHACEEPIAHVVPLVCASRPAAVSEAPGALHVFADSIAGASAEFNRSVVGPPSSAPSSLFLPAENPVFRDLCMQTSGTAGGASTAAPAVTPEMNMVASPQRPAPDADLLRDAVTPNSSLPATEDEPTWVIIGIVIASIAIAVLSLLLLLLLRPCRLRRRSVEGSNAANSHSTSDKSSLTHPTDHSNADRGPPRSPAGDATIRPEDDTGSAAHVSVAPRNAVDCGRPDERSADWARDPHAAEAIEASVRALSRERIASVLQVSLEQADMYMHHALGHKSPPFRDSSPSATSGRSSRSYGMPSLNHGRPMDSLSAASLSAASAAAASSAAVVGARPRSDSRESQRQPQQSVAYLPSSLSYATSAADPAYGLPQHTDALGQPNQGRGYGAAGVASPQWVHSVGSEASGRGFNMLPGWQEETQEMATQRHQSFLPQAHARIQRRRMSSGAQYAYTAAWGSFGTGSSSADVSPVNHLRVSGSIAPFHARQPSETYEADSEAVRSAQLDGRRWSAGVDPARLREAAERGPVPREWTSGAHGQGEGWLPHAGQKSMHGLAVQQRRQQERLAFQYEMQYREAQRW